MSTRTRLASCAIFLLTATLSHPVLAAEGGILRVAVRDSPPFSFQDPDGQWRGISVQLWREIASRNGYQFTLEASPLDDLIDGVRQGKYDIGVGGISITSERERIVDFSQPFLSSHLGIAYLQTESPWLVVLKKFLSLAFLKVVLLLFFVLLLAGLGVWLFERKGNEEFSGRGIRGLGAAFWWSAVTMTTVGYGDKSPRTLGGRVVALLWMFVSVIILTSFTAAIVASLTTASYHKEKSLSTLVHDKVGVIQGSVSENLLRDYNMTPVTFDSCDDMIDALLKGQVNDVLHDLPVLRFYALRNREAFTLVTLNDQRQQYGLVLPRDAPIENSVDVELLSIVRTPDWNELLKRYLGE